MTTSKIQIKKAGGFKGMKISLTSITVKKFINSKNELEYMIYAGKGTGAQIAGTLDYNECLLFDANYTNVTYRFIFNKATKAKGGAYFYKNTDKLFFTCHPFLNDGFIFSSIKSY